LPDARASISSTRQRPARGCCASRARAASWTPGRGGAREVRDGVAALERGAQAARSRRFARRRACRGRATRAVDRSSSRTTGGRLLESARHVRADVARAPVTSTSCVVSPRVSIIVGCDRRGEQAREGSGYCTAARGVRGRSVRPAGARSAAASISSIHSGGASPADLHETPGHRRTMWPEPLPSTTRELSAPSPRARSGGSRARRRDGRARLWSERSRAGLERRAARAIVRDRAEPTCRRSARAGRGDDSHVEGVAVPLARGGLPRVERRFDGAAPRTRDPRQDRVQSVRRFVGTCRRSAWAT